MDTPVQPTTQTPQKPKSRSGMIGILGILCFLILVGIGGYILLKKEVRTPETTTQSIKPAAQSEVMITANGFEPATIQVVKGTQVTFTNKDSKPHQVASDPHPTHTGLPGFDSLDPLATNDSYSFTFEKVGTFTYHDHLNPFTIKGTVIVK